MLWLPLRTQSLMLALREALRRFQTLLFALSSSQWQRSIRYAVVGRCCHRRPAMLTPPGRNSVVLQQIARRPQRPESSATAGAGGGWGIVWLAVGESGMVVWLRARTEPTNAPTVEADDATAGGGTHGQGASATGRTAGSGWGCRCFAGHSVRRGRIRCQCACPRTNDGRTASDHHHEQARASAQRDLRPADVRHNMNCRRRTPDAHNRSTQACRARCSRQGLRSIRTSTGR